MRGQAPFVMGMEENRENNIGLFGRLPIFTSIEGFDPEDPQGIVDEVNEALVVHVQNLLAMEYLYWYRRGVTPIYARTKEVRPEINNKISENHAGEIVDFKNGYFLTQSVAYTSRKEDEEITEKVNILNEYLYRSGKQQVDNELVDWFHTVGKADLFVQSNDDEEAPFIAYALDPRSAFVVKSMSPGNEPVYAVHSVVRGEELILDVWDRFNVYTLKGTVTGTLTTPTPNYTCTAVEVIDRKPNPLGEIPIIEYHYNSVGMSAFESVIPLLDAMNELMSDRLDGVDQFIQSLLVFYNCTLEDDEGNEITPKYVRESGALFLKSVGENRADLKEISSQLDQTQTQVLVDHIYKQICIICGMPMVQSQGVASLTGAAVEMRNGWATAETMARNTEDLFRKSNKFFDRIITKILREKNLLDIRLADIELNFIRNDMYGVQSKAQALQTLLTAGLHPTIALAKSGISSDPVADFENSKGYMRMRWGDPDAPIAQPETEITESDNYTGGLLGGGVVG